MNSENNTNWGSRPVKTQNIDTAGEKTPRRVLSPQEIEERKRRAEERRQRAEEEKREKRETRIVCLAFGSVIYLVVCLLIVGFVALLYFGGGGEEFNELNVVDGKGEVLHVQSDEEFIIGDVPYISATGLGTLYDFTLAGDKKQVTLHFHNIDQSVSLYKDSSAVVINGVRVRLNAPIIFTDDYYIPLELIKNYFLGAIIEYDSEEGVAKLSRQAGDDSFSLRIRAPGETVLPDIE